MDSSKNTDSYKNTNFTKNKNFYEILNVEKNATINQIKKQYLKLAVILHPDKGGSDDEFKQLAEAYKILSDPEKRKLYDTYGKTENINLPKTDPFEMFTNMFGMKSINPLDIHITKDFDLYNLYSGIADEIHYERNIPCNNCNGKGEIFKEVLNCSVCNGKGKVVLEETNGLIVNRIIINCNHCNGTGKFVKNSQICRYCEAKGTVNEHIIDTINISPGIPVSESITIKGKGHIHPNGSIGNLIVNLNIKEHHFFHRKGSMLLMKKSISIADALCGFTFYLQHLDKHILKINIPHGKVITPNSVFKIRGQGMPIYGKDNYYSDLLVQFKVDFPTKISLNENQKNMLISMFPGISAMKGDIKYNREGYVEEVDTQDSEDKSNCTQQ
jgi:DnaJ homolog subfamily A member 2